MKPANLNLTMTWAQQSLCSPIDGENSIALGSPIVIPRQFANLGCTSLKPMFISLDPDLLELLKSSYEQSKICLGISAEDLHMQTKVCGLIESGLRALYANLESALRVRCSK